MIHTQAVTVQDVSFSRRMLLTATPPPQILAKTHILKCIYTKHTDRKAGLGELPVQVKDEDG